MRKVYIDYNGSGADSLVQELIRTIYDAGGVPFFHCFNSKFLREILFKCNEEQIRIMTKLIFTGNEADGLLHRYKM